MTGFVHRGFAEQAGEGNLQLREVDAAHEDGNNRHDDVVRDGFCNGGEGCADNGTNSQGHGIALDGKGCKLIQPLWLFGFFHPELFFLFFQENVNKLHLSTFSTGLSTTQGLPRRCPLRGRRNSAPARGIIY